MTIYSSSPAKGAVSGRGSKDGIGSGDHDQPYVFGRRPRAVAPFPFHPGQYARLLALRGRIADGLYAADDLATSGVTLEFVSIAQEEPAA